MAKHCPSPFRINKYKTFYKFIDVNKDGVIDDKDCEIVAMNLARQCEASEQEASEIRKAFLECWKINYGEGDPKLTIDEAVRGVIQFHSTANPADQIEIANKFYQKVFALIDRNKDGLLSRKEFGFFYKAYGVLDEDFIKRVFNNIDKDHDDFISREEFIKAQSAFWFSDDPKNGFEFLYDTPV